MTRLLLDFIGPQFAIQYTPLVCKNIFIKYCIKYIVYAVYKFLSTIHSPYLDTILESNEMYRNDQASTLGGNFTVVLSIMIYFSK